jgi:hypothetical protein
MRRKVAGFVIVVLAVLLISFFAAILLYVPNQSSTNSGSSSGQITVVTVALYAGSASNATTQGTAALYLVIHNPGPPTSVSSIEISRSTLVVAQTFYQCASLTSCSPTSSPVINGNSDSNFTSPRTGFFAGAKIGENLSYNYKIAFANGETVSGTVTSVSKIPK